MKARRRKLKLYHVNIEQPVVRGYSLGQRTRGFGFRASGRGRKEGYDGSCMKKGNN